eukprot:CAMPEP_0183301214 /NCGR_PEP_ID=MMETSP0160_2-20130417/7396_1 /TAXON_ID=2839 ORGANISM="Odontella Sinensis, Strain Grunow 1884" /NCGR_SAMPLE_ID=MMETSP0160_2 /ASSEMBLY_ACC=CAM_ASM_000250 /LENGTH=38 /DNA_ID= /DNA_START= /DNA_END= /DNA_ORIENTATION=
MIPSAVGQHGPSSPSAEHPAFASQRAPSGTVGGVIGIP